MQRLMKIPTRKTFTLLCLITIVALVLPAQGGEKENDRWKRFPPRVSLWLKKTNGEKSLKFRKGEPLVFVVMIESAVDRIVTFSGTYTPMK